MQRGYWERKDSLLAVCLEDSLLLGSGAVDVSWCPCTVHDDLGNQPEALLPFLPLGVWAFFSYSAVVPGRCCPIHGEGKGAVGAGQPCSGFSSSSHESLGVLGGSLALAAVLSISLEWQEPGPALESCIPLGTQVCPFGLPSSLSGVGLHLLEQAPGIPQNQQPQGKLLPAALGSPLCILPTPIAE